VVGALHLPVPAHKLGMEIWLAFTWNGWVTVVGEGDRLWPSPHIDAVFHFREDIEDGVEEVEVLAVEDADVDGGSGA